MNFVSLFSGIGGFDLGFERAGMTCVAQVERDKHALSVLARHWPDVPRFEDVRDVGKHNLPSVDVICGGFPCQDVSVAGRRAGLAGERSGLWFEFHRILGDLRPRFVVIENVPGLLSSNGGRDFAVILQGLVEHGYRVTWRVLDAQHFGLAQRRKRVFIVGSLGSGAAAEILLESESVRGNSSQGRETGEDIAAAITARAGKGGFTDPVNDNVIAFKYNASNKSDRTQIVRQGDYTGALQTGTTDAVLMNGLVRRLTPTECERLQGFPDGWTAGQSDSARYRQLGNAVAVPVAEWIGRRLMRTANRVQASG